MVSPIQRLNIPSLGTATTVAMAPKPSAPSAHLTKL